MCIYYYILFGEKTYLNVIKGGSFPVTEEYKSFIFSYGNNPQEAFKYLPTDLPQLKIFTTSTKLESFPRYNYESSIITIGSQLLNKDGMYTGCCNFPRCYR